MTAAPMSGEDTAPRAIQMLRRLLEAGLVASLFVAAVAALLVLGDSRRAPIQPLLPAAMLLLLLAPGVALQSVGTSWGVFAAWLLGTAAGSYLGIVLGIHVRGAEG